MSQSASDQIVLGGEPGGMRLVSAQKQSAKRKVSCPTCDVEIPKGEECWREVWRDGREQSTEYYHLRCDILDEPTRIEYRNAVVEQLRDER